MQDTVNAFVPDGIFRLDATGTGPLDGMQFAAKDLFDVEGKTTGAGSPAWLRTHAPATATADAILTVLGDGATFVGKTLTDELAYSINGDNVHYGTPTNTRAPTRFPGGSSSGSAAAVAGGLVDFALGTDSGGSNRVPASFCGLFGIRSTHGKISRAALVPLMPSFDTVGWFARDIATFEKVGASLMPNDPGTPITRLLVSEDAQGEVEVATHIALHEVLAQLQAHVSDTSTIALTETGLEAWRLAYRPYSAFESWQIHGAWIRDNNPDFSPVIAERFQYAASVSRDEADAAKALLDAHRRHLRDHIRPGTVLLAPSTPGPAPQLATAQKDIELFRQRAQRLTCVAGIGGLPEVSLPCMGTHDAPIGLSLIGAPGEDRALIAFARSLLSLGIVRLSEHRHASR
jgi:amidase